MIFLQADKGKPEEQKANQRPISWSLHKFFKSSKPKDSESFVAVQVKEPETGWKQPLEAESKVFAMEVEEAQASESQPVQQAPVVQQRKRKGGRPPQSRNGQKNVILTGQQRVFAVQYVEDYLKQPGNSKSKGLDSVSK